jgi:hypothetical protein
VTGRHDPLVMTYPKVAALSIGLLRRRRCRRRPPTPTPRPGTPPGAPARIPAVPWTIRTIGYQAKVNGWLTTPPEAGTEALQSLPFVGIRAPPIRARVRERGLRQTRRFLRGACLVAAQARRPVRSRSAQQDECALAACPGASTASAAGRSSLNPFRDHGRPVEAASAMRVRPGTTSEGRAQARAGDGGR